MKNITEIISNEIGRPVSQVENVVTLIDEGNTIPFIARYRKEAHGGMDDTMLRKLDDRLRYLRNLETRKEEVIKAIDGQEKLTPELETEIIEAQTLVEVENLYRPYKQKRKTRASVAKEKGLEPLALALYLQAPNSPSPETAAEKFINKEKDVNTIEEALAGASDIIAEMVSDSADYRKKLGERINRNGSIKTVAAKEEDSVYRNYYDFAQPVSKIASHQVLALNRGEKEGFLKVSLDFNREEAIALLEKNIIRKGSSSEEFLREAICDGYDRLLSPSLENEVRASLTEKASDAAIANFALNLRPLLMQPPVKGKVTMGLDPGYRMGCKVAVVNGTGKVLDTGVVYPTLGERQKLEAIEKLSKMIKKHKVEHIAIGNGTASRETEQMAVEMIAGLPGVSYMIVNEAGASVYSASKLGAEEFPQFDVNLRSAVSIARRMQDPLAELVKIDPKSIGVGQYQHDMPQKRLDESLTAVVEDCVNAVGVDLNTASPSLLQRVAGLSSATAKNIVAYREENGIFSSRKQVLKVPKIGPKAFEQCAGFLRVAESKNILDNTGVHPESYEAAEKLLTLCGYSINDVKAGNISELKKRVEDIGYKKAAESCGTGDLTLKDIVTELLKPGRDPRDTLPPPVFKTGIMEVSDLKAGMLLTGTVRNVTDFGAFVDVGVHQDGLVHISEISNRFLKHPSEALTVGQNVEVIVLSTNEKTGKISLSIKQAKNNS